MPRLESQAKAGYYPTPEVVVGQISGILNLAYVREPHKQSTRFLDPCCGTGTALMLLAEKLALANRPAIETYGVELSADRVVEARTMLDNVLAGDLFSTSYRQRCVFCSLSQSAV